MEQGILQSSSRSPTLETIKMVEETISEYNGEFKKTQIFLHLKLIRMDFGNNRK